MSRWILPGIHCLKCRPHHRRPNEYPHHLPRHHLLNEHPLHPPLLYRSNRNPRLRRIAIPSPIYRSGIGLGNFWSVCRRRRLASVVPFLPHPLTLKVVEVEVSPVWHSGWDTTRKATSIRVEVVSVELQFSPVHNGCFGTCTWNSWMDNPGPLNQATFWIPVPPGGSPYSRHPGITRPPSRSPSDLFGSARNVIAYVYVCICIYPYVRYAGIGRAVGSLYHPRVRYVHRLVEL